MLALAAPILVIQENETILRAYSRALRLNYGSSTKSTRLNTGMILVTWGVFLSLFERSIQYVNDLIQHGDEYLPAGQNLWLAPFLGMPYSTAYFVGSVFSIAAYLSLFISTAFFLVGLYHELQDHSLHSTPSNSTLNTSV